MTANRDDIPLPALYAGHKAQDPGFQDKLASVVYAAGELGILAGLDGGPRPVQELAGDLGLPPDRLGRLLRALIALDVVAEPAPGVFEAGTMARFTPAPPYRHPASRSADPFVRAWPALAEAIRSGRTAFEIANGAPLFEFLAGEPELRAAFDRRMAARGADRDAALAAGWTVGSAATVADLGGAGGSVLAAITAADPGVRGLLVDRADVLSEAAARLPERIEAVPADLLGDRLPDADVYLLSSVLHDFDDGSCRRILTNVGRSMAAEARLLVVELVLPLPGEPVLGPLFDLEMLVLTGGRERTAGEYGRLLADVGLETVAMAPLTGVWSMVEARRR